MKNSNRQHTDKPAKKTKRSLNFKRIFFRLFVCGFILSGIAVFAGFIFFTQNLPSPSILKEYNPTTSTKIFSRDGVLLSEYTMENRIFTRIDDIPDLVKKAFLAAEDAKFYQHIGIDFASIVRAVVNDIEFYFKKDGRLLGASTITQQVVKNTLLTNERTMSRKIKEIILSLEVEKILSKDQIFEIYLNHIFLGNGAYGIMAASLEYFGKPLKDLEIHEVALLASLPKAPTELNPRKYKEEATNRRNYVIKQMAVNGFIDWSSVPIYQEKPITLAPHRNKTMRILGSNHVADYTKNLAIEKVGNLDGMYIQSTIDSKFQSALFDGFRKVIFDYDKRHGFRGKLGSIGTTDWCPKLKKFTQSQTLYDLELQYAVVLKSGESSFQAGSQECDTVDVSIDGWNAKLASGNIVAIKKNQSGKFVLSQFPQINGASMIIDVKNGDVLAQVGDFYDRPASFNRAIFAKRQPGSSVKPFTYLTGLQNGFTPASILVDEQIKMSDDWAPENDSGDYLGAITLRTAIERSRNVPTVRLAEMVGVTPIINTFKKFDLVPDSDTIPYELSTVLGSFSTTVERMAVAYSAFPNGGYAIEPTYIEKVQNNSGETLLRKGNIKCTTCDNSSVIPSITPNFRTNQLIDSDVAYQVTSLLEGGVRRGTGIAASHLAPDGGIAGKTGTTSDNKDSWFAGFTQDFAIITYIGFDQPQSLGGNEYGATLALPIFVETMKSISEWYKIKPFNVPTGIEFIDIDYNTGLLPSENSRIIKEVFKKSDKRPLSYSQSMSQNFPSTDPENPDAEPVDPDGEQKVNVYSNTY